MGSCSTSRALRISKHESMLIGVKPIYPRIPHIISNTFNHSRIKMFIVNVWNYLLKNEKNNNETNDIVNPMKTIINVRATVDMITSLAVRLPPHKISG